MNGWAIVNSNMSKFHYVAATRESAAQWLRFKLKHQARGEKYVGPVEIRVVFHSHGDPPASVPRSDMTGEQLRAAYEACKTTEPTSVISSKGWLSALDAAWLAIPDFEQKDDCFTSKDGFETFFLDTLLRIVDAAAKAEREICARQMERLGCHEYAHCLRNYPNG
jgi:hypothetical protein